MPNHDQYAQASIHRWMLRDQVRNEAYRRALRWAVKPGARVLDMGAGTAVLSVFAAQAGAGEVFAVERTSIADMARRMVQRNQVADRVVVIHSDLEDADLPGKVDVLVSEWMGGLGVDENMLAPLVMARDRWLRPGGIIIPSRVTAMLAPAYVAEFDDALEHWASRPHGIDLSELAIDMADEVHMTQIGFTVDDLLATAQPMWSHDAYTCTLEEADRPFVTSLDFRIERAGKLSGVLAWFTADMGGEITLTTAVGAPPTHWGRLLFPLRQAAPVAEGARVRVEVHCDPSSQGSCEFYWAIQVDDGPVERHDTRRSRVAAFARPSGSDGSDRSAAGA
jgi:type I protein arginine methyltransferase